jgi:acyl transferase domain-containing protein/NAD(P)-dependent dehydrogenase (short-subunit alcohol dehydrogenase family)/acyl carrier protein
MSGHNHNKHRYDCRKMSNKKKEDQSIAIIGMECIFPRASDLKEFWRVILNGEDGITDVPKTHWSVQDYYHSNPKHPDHTYCKRGGFLSPISYDPAEFGIPPNSLEATDTSQLLSLMVAKKALEDAGYGMDREFNRDKTSVILGATGTQELVIPLGARLGHPIWRKALKDSGVDADLAEEVMERISTAYVPWQENSFPGLLGNVIAGRIANRLDLGGTNCVVDAACASSMSAINLAILELITGKADMTVTGGVDALNDIFMHMCFSQTGVLSHSSDAMPFSENADGTVLGEGIGMLVMKRLEDAEKDGDRIYAVVKAIGTSSDGKSQSIYAPNAIGQAKALRMAYQDADVDPGTIELIEAHGTGTRVGDAVEFSALKEVFNDTKKKGNQCALGSIKSNIGHTKASAGAAGLIKAVLALHHKVLPATLKAETPDPKLEIQDSPFYLNSSSRPWVARKNHPRRSGVSAFGFGGSNFHVVLEEYNPKKQVFSWDGRAAIAAMSAAKKEDLLAKLLKLKQDMEKNTSFEDIILLTSNLNTSFSEKDDFRVLLVLERSEEHDNQKKSSIETINLAIETLHQPDTTKVAKNNIYFNGPCKKNKLAFLFPGQGSQYPGMGKDLITLFPVASEVLEKVNKIHQKENKETQPLLSDRIFPLPLTDKTENEEKLRSTDIAQPAIGAVSLGMLKILEHFGLKPDAVCGHSYGELPALYASGMINEDDLISLSAKRGKYMADAGQGDSTMLAVKAPLADLEAIIAENKLDVILANRNGPQQGVLSGSIEAIDEAKKICKEKKFRAIPLPVAAAFHTRHVQKAAKPFQKAVKSIKIHSANIPVYSNTTGMPYPDDPKQAAAILGEQLLNPVDFLKEIENLYDSGVRSFVEIGPKPVLTGLVKTILKGKESSPIALDSSSGKKSGIADLARTLCQLSSEGYEVDFSKWENPSPAPRKQMMSIPISGANYRSPFQQKPPSSKKPIQILDSEQTQSRPQTVNRLPETRKPVSLQATTPELTKTEPVAVPNENSRLVSDALQVVSESLKSMQALQTQTAETHKKFLETQTEASKNLQLMMERTRNMTQAAMGLPSQSALFQPEMQIHPVQTPPIPQKQADPMMAEIPISRTIPSAKVVTNEIIPRKETEIPDIGRKDIQKNMLEVVSELTGYPVEMLDPTMDIEADLGIDSIKRVEILSSFEEKMPGMPQVSNEIMGELKTLGQIIDYLVTLSNTTTSEDSTIVSTEEQESLDVSYTYPSESKQEPEEIVEEVERQIISIVEKPLTMENPITIPQDRIVYILDDQTGLGKEIANVLGRREIKTSLISGNLFADPEKLQKTLVNAGGLILIPDVDLLTDRFNKKSFWNEKDELFLKNSFIAANLSAKSLIESASEEGGLFTTITRLDGSFGFAGQGILHPLQGGLAGLAKTAAIEWENVCCHAIDVAPTWKDIEAAALAVCNEILHKGPIEVGLGESHRCILELTLAPSPEGRILLDEKDVIIVTGGARGVTAACTYTLAKHAKPTIILMGRSQLPAPEPTWLKTIIDESAMKKAILQNEFSGKKVTPVQVNQVFNKYMGGREIMKNLSRLKATGATVEYISVDVRDIGAVNSILKDVRSNYGPIRGIIHGAGVLEDRFIKDKTIEQFSRVFDTKAKGLSVLMEATAKDKLKYLVFFSSVAARIGNKGQVDYAMANEVLNKIAQQEAFSRKNCRVISINWGPWDGGMVTPSLKKEFSRMNISLIPIKEGAMSMLYEMMGDKTSPVEVVIGATITPDHPISDMTAQASEPVKNQKQTQKNGDAPLHPFEQSLDVDTYPILEAHVLDEKPVVPFAIIAEWFGHAAMREKPGYTFCGIDDMRLLSGIKLQKNKNKIIRMIPGETQQNGKFIEIGFQLVNGAQNGKKTIHSKAKAILSDTIDSPPSFTMPELANESKYSKSLDESYDKILFHGAQLRGIQKIIGYSHNGMVAELSNAPTPDNWIKNPYRQKWITDPLVLDAAYQMAILWCHETTGLVSLPSYSASYRQYQEEFPADGVTAILEVKELTDHKMKGNFTFLNSDNRIVAAITGYEAIMDASLMKAFQK